MKFTRALALLTFLSSLAFAEPPKTIDQLEKITTPATGDVIALWDVSQPGTSKTRGITFGDFRGALNILTPNGNGSGLTGLTLGQTSGNLPISRLNSGTNANGDTFWAGDGTWKALTASVDGQAISPASVTATSAVTVTGPKSYYSVASSQSAETVSEPTALAYGMYARSGVGLGFKSIAGGFNFSTGSHESSLWVTASNAISLRMQRRVVAVAYATTVTINSDAADVAVVGPLTGNLSLANPSGTPTDQQSLQVELRQDATGGRTLTLGSKYRIPSSSSLSSPISTSDFIVASKKTKLGLLYDATDDKWDVISFVPGY